MNGGGPIPIVDGADDRRHRCLARAVTFIVDFSRTATRAAARAGDAKLVHNAPIAVLAQLAVSGPLRPRDLGAHLELTTGGMSNLLGRLEQRGVITRHASGGADQRGVLVELTPKGVEIVDRLSTAVFASLAVDEALIKETILALVESGASPSPMSTATEDRSALRVMLALATIGVAMQRSLDRRGEGEPTHDANAELAAIALFEFGPCRPSRLVDLLAISSAGVSRLVDRLERQELVERRAAVDGADGRSVEVVLTEAGRRHVEVVLEQMAPHLDEVLGALRVFLEEMHRDDWR